MYNCSTVLVSRFVFKIGLSDVKLTNLRIADRLVPPEIFTFWLAVASVNHHQTPPTWVLTANIKRTRSRTYGTSLPSIYSPTPPRRLKIHFKYVQFFSIAKLQHICCSFPSCKWRLMASDATVRVSRKTKRPRSRRGPTRRCPVAPLKRRTMRPRRRLGEESGPPARRRVKGPTRWRKQGRVGVDAESVGWVYLLENAALHVFTIVRGVMKCKYTNR